MSFICRPTQSVMYVPLQVNRFAESVLLIVQYRHLKLCSGEFNSPESDLPHKIMRYWFYYLIWLGFSFPPDRICQMEMICIGGVPVSKRHFGGAGPSIFYMIHRGGWSLIWYKRDVIHMMCVAETNATSFRWIMSLLMRCYSYECYSYECYSYECYSYQCYSYECYSHECYSYECYSYECYSYECYSYESCLSWLIWMTYWSKETLPPGGFPIY